jgi:hypothetical protein
METYYTDHQSYTGGDAAALKLIEPALKNANVLVATPTTDGKGYSVSVTSKGSNTVKYTISNDAGTVTRACDKKDTGGCGNLIW